MKQRSFAFITLAAGVLLCAVGIGAGLLSDSDSLTRFIPLLFGVPVLICGVIGLGSAKARMHAAHVALLFAIIALLGSAGKIPSTVHDGTGLALASQLLMLLIAAGYLALGIRSFMNARRKRKAQEAIAK